jgi:hypothetical protein
LDAAETCRCTTALSRIINAAGVAVKVGDRVHPMIREHAQQRNDENLTVAV